MKDTNKYYRPSLFQICVEGNCGSTGRIAEEIGIMAIEHGWNSYIAHGRFPRPSKSNLIRIGSNWSVFLHGLKTRLFDRHCLGSKHATRVLVRQIKSIQPDVVHLHHIHGYYVNMKILFNYLSKANIPVVWTFHDCWSITGHCAYFDFVGCDKWKTECHSCPQKKAYPASIFIDRSRKNYYQKKALFLSVPNMTVVPVSEWLGDIVHESFMSNVPVQVIHNGIDTTLFNPQANRAETREKYKIGDRTMLLGVASPWVERKGLDDFFKLSKLIDSNTVIMLVGLSKPQLESLPANIIGIARTENRQQLVDLYSAADLFINPTWEDNFPTTNIEALACGTPVVTYRTGGSIEAVTPETGFIVEKGDVVGLNNTINVVRQKGRETYAEKCRERAISCFDKKDRFSEYFHLYDQLLNT